jgi:ASC-1-like (ASCH) protein
MEIEIAEPYFSLIYSGRKPVEGRKMSPKWRALAVGTVLKVTCPTMIPYHAIISKINYYPPGSNDPLTDYLICEGLNQVLPGVTSLEEGRKIYLQWSTQDEINNYGMMGIHLEVLV